jgi:membrane-associated phospholipid phosphatase
LLATRRFRGLLAVVFLLTCATAQSRQHSVARQWNEALLASIRQDYARPTVHARNLFHSAIAMWDAWSAFGTPARPYLLGRTLGSFNCPFEGISRPDDLERAREIAISYAAFRLLSHRFAQSPGAVSAALRYVALMSDMGLDTSFTSTDYRSGHPAALGNYIARCVIAYGLQDGANEANGYANRHYRPVNPPLSPTQPGNPSLLDPNRWQPLALEVFIDQSGNVVPGGAPEFVGPEWGNVEPFALTDASLGKVLRDGFEFTVYHDPGPPPRLGGPATNDYQWGFALVAVWSSHLDPADGVEWDISPASMGNLQWLPDSLEQFKSFYDLDEGGDHGQGHRLNPHTGQPYTPQRVPRADYARVLAEFWADGPQSETPPGHWFVILNQVSDDPRLKKRLGGTGAILDDLQWDVKAYLALGGAMHDAAVAAWGLKGRYDYVRPISAIRSMAETGQSSDPALPRYHPQGIPLLPGFIESIGASDPLAGPDGEFEGQIKLYAWRGPSHIEDPATGTAGVGWIRAADWWPYQRPSFVTPPFAGYVSGHSTYSRAAAEILTHLTGDAYFPGGMGVFPIHRNDFLVFEEGPSIDFELQWATYRDAADQCALSRIWGGIHPPADDIAGRRLGTTIGRQAWAKAAGYIDG